MNEEKTLTFIVPVYGESGLYLGRCLHSLLDNQDYPYKNVIVVYDGNGEEQQMASALKQEENFKDDERIEFHVIEHGGAPKARNFGLKKAKGDYVCFFDCDSVLMAGGLRTWIHAFEENPECGFVYGGYRFFVQDGRNIGIPAQPFDKWLLTCNNYISSMNPIKRELCPKWDEDLKSLQDWDLWLRVVQSGVKGKMIPDWVVMTEPPSDNSLSGYSHKNWLELFNKVRKKNGIKKREIAVTTMGAFFQSQRRAKILDGDYRDPAMLSAKPHEYKAIISMGYYINSEPHAYTVFAGAEKAKKIIHFIGTDVYQILGHTFASVNFLRKQLPQAVDHIFCNAPWLKAELDEIGIPSELLYCPIDPKPYQITPYPEKFTVAVYCSDTNPMHNTNFIFDVAKSCPDIKWKFFGETVYADAVDLPKNIECTGKVLEEDMPELIASTSCILRLTVHDGFPATVAEWAMCGRPSITNLKNMPFTKFAEVNPRRETAIEDKEKTIKAIRELQRSFKNNPYSKKELTKMRKHYVKLLDPEVYRKRIYEVVDE